MLTHQTLLGVGRSPKLLILVGLTIRGDEVSLALHKLQLNRVSQSVSLGSSTHSA